MAERGREGERGGGRERERKREKIGVIVYIAQIWMGSSVNKAELENGNSKSD